MDPKVAEALALLGFDDLSIMPKMRAINKKYRKLAYLHHPDRNNGSKEATVKFQSILNAYQIAGKAAETNPEDPADHDELVARRMFSQFQLSSVKENSRSFTIFTEKSLYASWMDALINFGGTHDDKGPHGNKFTVEDTYNDIPVKVYLTLYKTGKLLVQAEKNKHSINLHFVNTHLERLFTEVYSIQKSLPTLRPKTPVTKDNQKDHCPNQQVQFVQISGNRVWKANQTYEKSTQLLC